MYATRLREKVLTPCCDLQQDAEEMLTTLTTCV